MKIKKLRIGSVLKGVFLILIVLFSIYPIIWTLINSFRSNTQILSAFRLIPEQINFDNYVAIFKEKTIITSFFNSVLVTGGTTVSYTHRDVYKRQDCSYKRRRQWGRSIGIRSSFGCFRLC